MRRILLGGALWLATALAANAQTLCTVNGVPCAGLASDGNPAGSTQQAVTAAKAAIPAGTPAPYTQLGAGPNTTGTGTASLLNGATGQYAYGSSGGVPLLRCDYIGETYTADLVGDFSLATTAPGNVVAAMVIGGTSVTATITNALAGTPGQEWDAQARITCLSAGGSSLTVTAAAVIHFQAVGNVYAGLGVGTTSGNLTVAATSGAFTFDLQRTFSNAANTMRIDTIGVNQEK